MRTLSNLATTTEEEENFEKAVDDFLIQFCDCSATEQIREVEDTHEVENTREVEDSREIEDTRDVQDSHVNVEENLVTEIFQAPNVDSSFAEMTTEFPFTPVNVEQNLVTEGLDTVEQLPEQGIAAKYE